MSVLVIIPVYNEEENILDVVKDIKQNAEGVDYIIINDCSRDGTEAILRKNALNYINLPVNLGIGGGVQTGYKYALENNYDIAVQFDGDGQHIAAYINELIRPIKDDEAEIVIGSRFLNNEGFQSSWQRRVGINILSTLLRLLSGIMIKDATSGFRAVNKRFIQVYADDYAQDYPEPEALMQAAVAKAKVREIPVTMRERQGGESSIKAYKAIYYMVKVSLAILLNRISFNSKGVK